MHAWNARMIIITARRSYASAVVGVVILSVCPSVCLSVRLSHACFVTNPKNLPAIFLYHILITANMQSKTGFPSSHQLKSYVAPKSCLKLAARFSVSGCCPSCCRSYDSDRPTEHATLSVAIGRICVGYVVLLCGIIVGSMNFAESRRADVARGCWLLLTIIPLSWLCLLLAAILRVNVYMFPVQVYYNMIGASFIDVPLIIRWTYLLKCRFHCPPGSGSLTSLRLHRERLTRTTKRRMPSFSKYVHYLNSS